MSLPNYDTLEQDRLAAKHRYDIALRLFLAGHGSPQVVEAEFRAMQAADARMAERRPRFSYTPSARPTLDFQRTQGIAP